MYVRLIVCCLLATLVAVGAAAAAPSLTSPPAPRLQAGLEEIEAAGAPGALAVLRDPTGTTVVTAGTSRLGGAAPIRLDQPVRAGSITKSFVAATTLVLVERGRVRLGDSVESWLPHALPRGDRITIRHLLQHTSGLSDGNALLERLLRDPSKGFTPMQVVRDAIRSRPAVEPGRRWEYANVNYALLGLIVEKATGQRLATVVRQNVIEPLRLRQTTLPAGVEVPRDIVRGYLPPGSTVVPAASEHLDVTATNPSWTWAAGAVVSSAADISTFYSALADGRIVSRRLLGVMTRTRPMSGGLGYGLGLLRVPTPCGAAFGHDGEIFGYTSLALTSRDGHRSIVLLANASHPRVEGAILGRMLALAVTSLCDSASA